MKTFKEFISESPLIHIRKFVAPKERRIRSLQVDRKASQTVCGAPVTDRDWTKEDLKRWRKNPTGQWNVCERCQSLLKEDAPTMSAGSGAVAGLGVEPNPEPPKKKRKKSLIQC